MKINDQNSFNEYLANTINSEPSEHYNSDGNSARAVVSRMKKGFLYSLWFECKEVAYDIKLMFTYEWEGVNTPIAWFIRLLSLPFLVWLVPFTRTYGRYKLAIKEYKKEYESQK